MKSLTVREEKARLISQLENISESALLEATELLIYATGIDRGRLLFEQDKSLSLRQRSVLKAAVAKRKKGVPLQYILGEWEFYSLPFKVGKGVLIPRADTEMLVDMALDEIGNIESPRIFDLCAGSGAIGIAIAKNISGAEVTLVEKSRRAFKFLKENCKINGVTANLQLLDIAKFKPLHKADLIVSNPPYIKAQDMKYLQREVKREPHMALFGGKDGLDFYRLICSKAHELLKTGGRLIFEIGYNEGAAVMNIMQESGFTFVEIAKDLNGNDRVVSGTLTD